ncbi:ABC transporter substrate-binding protein [uncultured Roseibium sp.]|uniref:ABC transporter substrate-binding protein n=1 Tax=uncultured Roseibium sp. TaxID=1936171 RepID=UPI0025927D13|nr:ABC transporter substrate-binding protein [uncultured Roseibium sp.]
MLFGKTIAALSLTTALVMPMIGAIPAAYAETPPNMLVVAAEIDDLISLDPQEMFEFSGSDYANNVYQRLIAYDPKDFSKGYQPAIAESWEISEDGKTFTFKIAEGLKFASGNPVTASDVAFSLRRAVLLKKTPSFILTQFGFTEENASETLMAKDDGTFVLVTDKKYAPSFVLNCMTAAIASIVDSKLVLENEVDGDLGNGWLKTNSAGSGPYQLTSWKPNESLTISANPNFSGDAPAMNRVVVRHIAESASQRLLLEKGDVDIVRNLSPEDVSGVLKSEGVKVMTDQRGRIMYISMNQQDPTLSKPKVIEAIKYLIDYDGMVNSFLKGQYMVHQAYLPLSYLGELKDKPYSFNIEKAKALLAESGLADGFEVEFIVRTAQERVEIAQSLQNTFGQAGIKASIVQGTGKETLGKYRARDFQIYVGAWGPDYPDPHTNADTFTSNPDNSFEAKLTGKLAWRNAWAADGYTERTAAAAQETDTAKRAEMYVQLQKDFQKEAPFAIMFQKTEQNALRANVEGYSIGAAISAVYYGNVTK